MRACLAMLNLARLVTTIGRDYQNFQDPCMTPTETYLDRLIAFPTVSRDSNLDLIAYARDILDGFGIESQLVPSEDGRKANLFATIGPKDKPGIVLSGP